MANLIANPGAADIWIVPVTEIGDAGLVEKLRGLLDLDELARSDRFINPEHGRSFVVARGMLRVLLSCYMRHSPRDISFIYGVKGKPALREHPDFHFNLAHSGALALYGFAGSPIGVDIEQFKTSTDWMKISARFFNQRENEELLALPEDQKLPGFFACWARKEAYLKAIGMGLAFPLNEFYAGAQPDMNEGGVDRPGASLEWYFKDLKLQDGYAGAVVTRSAPARIRMFAFSNIEDCVWFAGENSIS